MALWTGTAHALPSGMMPPVFANGGLADEIVLHIATKLSPTVRKHLYPLPEAHPTTLARCALLEVAF